MKRIALLLLLFITACSSVNNEAVTSTLTVTMTFTPAPTPKTSETPTPSIDSEYQSLQILFDTQKVSYSIQDGKIVIDDGSTPAKENIILNPESGKVIQTNDGLAKKIVIAVDTDDNRMIFIEGFGWVTDINIPEKLTFQNRVKIPFGWTKINSGISNTVLNTVVSLHYFENPTIPVDASDPNDWISVNYYGGPVLFLGLKPMNGPQVDPEYNAKKLMKSFVWSGVFETTAPNGQNIIIFAQTRKNSTPDNPDQLINLFVAFDQSTEDKIIEEQGDDSVLEEILESKRKDLALVFSPPKGFDWVGQGLEFAKQPSNPTVAGLYDQGEIFSLLRSEDQQVILSKLGSEKEAADYSTKIPFIPPEFALKIFYPAVGGW